MSYPHLNHLGLVPESPGWAALKDDCLVIEADLAEAKLAEFSLRYQELLHAVKFCREMTHMLKPAAKLTPICDAVFNTCNKALILCDEREG